MCANYKEYVFKQPSGEELFLFLLKSYCIVYLLGHPINTVSGSQYICIINLHKQQFSRYLYLR